MGVGETLLKFDTKNTSGGCTFPERVVGFLLNFSQISFSLKRNPVICLVIFQREFLPFSPHPWRTTIFLQRKVSANFSHNPHPRLEVSAKFSRNKSGFFHVFSSVGIREKIHFFSLFGCANFSRKTHLFPDNGLREGYHPLRRWLEPS